MNQSKKQTTSLVDQVVIEPLKKEDIDAADLTYRLAFGTFLGVPEPRKFAGDARIIQSRWEAEPETTFCAKINNKLVGVNFVRKWGTVGGFGPLVVTPEFWGKRIASRLLEPVNDLFNKWDVKHSIIFTHATSPKHIGLYQKIGFWPRFLTAVMAIKIHNNKTSDFYMFSELSNEEKKEALAVCQKLTDAIYNGLDVAREIVSVDKQKLGDTLLVYDNSKLKGFAVCHQGSGTEAGSNHCYIKFAAILPDVKSGQYFNQLLDACESFSFNNGIERLSAGVNLGCYKAFQSMFNHGFRTFMQGVAMQKPNEAGILRDDVYIINDWR